MPSGETQCPTVGGKASTPGAACWAGPAATPSVATIKSGASATTPSSPSKPKPSSNPLKSGKSPIAYNLAGYCVSLSESTNALAPGGSITLTASSCTDVGPTPYYIEIYDQNSGSLLGNACPSGKTCSASFSSSSAGTHTFIAYVGTYSSTNPPSSVAATSGTVSCTWLSITLVASPQFTSPGVKSSITAYSNVDVGPTPYWIEVFNLTAGGNSICYNGYACTITAQPGGPINETFAAYISGYGTSPPPPNVQVSTSIVVVWYGVSITANYSALAPGGTTTLTATATASVTYPSPYYISIFDRETGTRLMACGSGSVCQANATETGSTLQHFVAYVGGGGASAPPGPVQATSNPVEVIWISVSLTICDSTGTICTPSGYVTAPNTYVYLTATATMDVGPTNYSIQFYDQTTKVYVDQCPSGTVCRVGVLQSGAVQRSYIAYVNSASYTYPPPYPRATSNSALAIWVSVQLFACNGQGVVGCTATNTTGTGTGAYLTLNAVANGQVTYSPYEIEIFDTAGQFLINCGTGSSCAYSVTESSAGTHTFIAFVSKYGTTYGPPTQPPAIQAQSAPLPLPWVTNCTSGVNTTNTPCDPTTFADNLLVYPSISAPVTGPNEYALQHWNIAEGGGGGCDSQTPGPWPLHQDGGYGAAANPFNTTQPEPGSYNYRTSPPYVQSYADYNGASCWYWGVKATADTLTNGYYPPILAVLRSPAADNHTQCVNLAYAITHPKIWGTGDFSGSC